MLKSDILVESKSLRESVIDKIEVLDRVKNLTMLPDDLHISIEMAASYYEVDFEAVKKAITRNKQELLSDGMKILTGDELRDMKSLSLVPKNAPSFTIIPKRAVLRLGMLLQDSSVAKRIRDYLLDTETKSQSTHPAVVPTSFGVEDLIIMQAQSVKELKAEVAELKEQRKADSEKLAEIDKVKETVTEMAEHLTAVPDSTVVVDAVNQLFRWTRINHNELYNMGYDMLKRQHGIDVRKRVENERERIQRDYNAKTGKYYSESTLKSKTNGITIMTQMGCLEKFHNIIVGMIAKEKAKSQLRLVK